jgi:hypothetical protein
MTFRHVRNITCHSLVTMVTVSLSSHGSIRKLYFPSSERRSQSGTALLSNYTDILRDYPIDKHAQLPLTEGNGY